MKKKIIALLLLSATALTAFQKADQPVPKIVRVKQTTLDTVGGVLGDLYQYFEGSNLPHKDVEQKKALIQKAYSLIYADSGDSTMNPKAEIEPAKPKGKP